VGQGDTAGRPLRLRHLQRKQPLVSDRLAQLEQRVPQPRRQLSDLDQRLARTVPLVYPNLSSRTINPRRQNLSLGPLGWGRSRLNLPVWNHWLEFQQPRSRGRRARHNPRIPRLLLVRLEGHHLRLPRNLNLPLDFRLRLLNLANLLRSVVLEGPARRLLQRRQLNLPSLRWTHQPSFNLMRQGLPHLALEHYLNRRHPWTSPLNPSPHLALARPPPAHLPTNPPLVSVQQPLPPHPRQINPPKRNLPMAD